MDEMVGAICLEISMRRNELDGQKLETIYFGGGTPSLLSAQALNQIFEIIYKHFSVMDDAEITLEANPDDLSVETLSHLSDSAVNRLSIGVQSFHDSELVWMNRAHSAIESMRCMEEVRNFGFQNFSIDLIYGLPHSSHELWARNLEIAIDLNVPHVSMYALTVEPNTALGKWVEKGKEEEPNDGYVSTQFNMGISAMEEAKYHHYEISNYAIPGKEAIHNSNYWRSRHYIGIGPSAHSFTGKQRSMNVAHNVKYMNSILEGKLPSEKEQIDDVTRYNEYVMTRLRTTWGINTDELDQYKDHFKKEVEQLIKRGWVSQDGKIYRLTQAGKHFADAAAAELFLV